MREKGAGGKRLSIRGLIRRVNHKSLRASCLCLRQSERHSRGIGWCLGCIFPSFTFRTTLLDGVSQTPTSDAITIMLSLVTQKRDGRRPFLPNKNSKRSFVFHTTSVSRARYQLSELHCCSFVRSLACLPAGLLALYSVFCSLYHLSFSRFLSLLAQALFTCVSSTLGQRWTLSKS